MQIQSLKIEIPDNAAFGAALPNVNRVFEWLVARGWNCTRASVNRHAGKGLIGRNEAGDFPLDAVQEYARNHWQIVNPALAVPEDPEPSATGSVFDSEAGLELGLDPALGRLRHVERTAYGRLMSAMESGTVPEAMFRSYGQSVELLRKAEKNLLDLQRERRELLPKAEIKTWLFRQIVSAKATLTNLPGKLAPQLEAQPWPKIQLMLEKEINHALDKLSCDPDTPMAGGLEAAGLDEPMAMGGGQS